MNSRHVVVYHGDCPDGFGSAWAAWKALGDTAEYLPASYGAGDLLERIGDAPVVTMVDFSCDRATALQLAQDREFRILDHHKSAMAELGDLPFCHFDMEHSGAVLAWHFFHLDKKVPTLLSYIEDRDIWRWRLANTKEITSFLDSWDRSFERWDAIAASVEDVGSDGHQGAVREGAAILRYKQQQVEMLTRQTQWREILGYKVPVVNTPNHMSELGNQLAKEHLDAAFAATYFDRKDGSRQWSLRSIGPFDVSVVAGQLGGGGHRNAAGFVEETP